MKNADELASDLAKVAEALRELTSIEGMPASAVRPAAQQAASLALGLVLALDGEVDDEGRVKLE